MRVFFFLIAVGFIPKMSMGQVHRVFIDGQKKIYKQEEINKIHKDDLFLAFRLIKRTDDTVLHEIQFYPKEQVAARFQTEGYYCGNRNSRKPVAEIRKMDFYSSVSSIRLTAFNVVDRTEMHYIPKNAKNEVDLSLANEVVILDSSLTSKLLDLLVNFDAEGDIEATFCDYDPRNAIVFFDKAGKQVGNIGICFECMKFEKSSESIPLGSFCREAYDTLQGFFRGAGIVYGTRVNEFNR
jgi:hypothetical protein